MGVSAIMDKVIDTAKWAKEVDEGINNGALVQSLGVASLRLARYGADRLGGLLPTPLPTCTPWFAAWPMQGLPCSIFALLSRTNCSVQMYG